MKIFKVSHKLYFINLTEWTDGQNQGDMFQDQGDMTIPTYLTSALNAPKLYIYYLLKESFVCFSAFSGNNTFVLHGGQLFIFIASLVNNLQSSRKLLKCYRTAVSQTEIFSRTNAKSAGQTNFGFN